MPVASFGHVSWVYFDGSESIRQGTIDALGEYVLDYDVDAIVEQYTQALNDVMPAGVSLTGDGFRFPVDEDGIPATLGIFDQIRDAIAIANFWAIAEKNDKSNRYS